MKVRVGFVSNSSSSSFCAIGMNFDAEYLKKLMKMNSEFNYEIEKIIEDNNLDLNIDWSEQDGYSYYIGQSVYNMPEDITLKEYKNQIKSELVKLFKLLNINKEIKVDILSGGWYNG